MNLNEIRTKYELLDKRWGELNNLMSLFYEKRKNCDIIEEEEYKSIQSIISVVYLIQKECLSKLQEISDKKTIKKYKEIIGEINNYTLHDFEQKKNMVIGYFSHIVSDNEKVVEKCKSIELSIIDYHNNEDNYNNLCDYLCFFDAIKSDSINDIVNKDEEFIENIDGRLIVYAQQNKIKFSNLDIINSESKSNITETAIISSQKLILDNKEINKQIDNIIDESTSINLFSEQNQKSYQEVSMVDLNLVDDKIDNNSSVYTDEINHLYDEDIKNNNMHDEETVYSQDVEEVNTYLAKCNFQFTDKSSLIISLPNKTVKYNKSSFWNTINRNNTVKSLGLILYYFSYKHIIFSETIEKSNELKYVIYFLHKEGYICKGYKENVNDEYFYCLSENGLKIYDDSRIVSLLQKHNNDFSSNSIVNLNILDDELYNLCKINELFNKISENKKDISISTPILTNFIKYDYKNDGKISYIFIVSNSKYNYDLSLLKMKTYLNNEDNKDIFLIGANKNTLIKWSNFINLINKNLQIRFVFSDKMEYCYDLNNNEYKTPFLIKKDEIQEQNEINEVDNKIIDNEVINDDTIRDLFLKLQKPEPLPYEEHLNIEEYNAKQVAEIIIKNELDPEKNLEVYDVLCDILIIENRYEIAHKVLEQLVNNYGLNFFQEKYFLLEYVINKENPQYNDMEILKNYENVFVYENVSDIYFGSFLSTLIRLLFRHENKYAKYFFKDWYDNLFSKDYNFPYYSNIKIIIKILYDTLVDVDQNGFSDINLLSIKGKKAIENQKKEVINSVNNIINFNNVPCTDYGCCNRLYGGESDLKKCLDIIRNNEYNVDFINKTLSVYKDKNNEISITSIDLAIKKEWAKNKKCNIIEISEHYLEKIRKEVIKRIKLCEKWISLETDEISSNLALNKMKDKLLDQINAFFAEKNLSTVGLSLVEYTLKNIQNQLSDCNELIVNEEFILSNELILNEEYKPVIIDLKYFSMLQRLIQHVYSYESSITYQDFLDYNLIEKENFGCINTFIKYANENNIALTYNREEFESQIKYINNDSIKSLNGLRDKISLDNMQGRIDDDKIEDFIFLLKQCEDQFIKENNYGFAKEYIDQINKALESSIEKKNIYYCNLMLSLIDNKSIVEYPIIEKIYIKLKNKKFSIVQEYINKLNDNIKTIDDDVSSEVNYYLEFNNKYKEILYVANQINGSAISRNKDRVLKMLQKFAKNELNINKTYRAEREMNDLIENWPNGISDFEKNDEKTINLLKQFDINVLELNQNIAKDSDYKHKIATIQVMNSNQKEFSHPISAFGTAMDNMISVIYLEGRKNIYDIKNIITKDYSVKRTIFVILDWALTIDDRRDFAKILKTQTLSNYVVVLDRILLLYMACIQNTERMKAFLQCSLPFSYCQPFSVSGQGLPGDEMFYGRIKELSQIINGQVNLVCGGRQLGKSALLDRAAHLLMNNEEKKYAILFRLSDKDKCSSNYVLEKIVNEIVQIKENGGKNTIISKEKSKSIKCMDDFESAIKTAYKRGEFKELHVFIDEADFFIDEEMKTGYKVLNSLRNLRDDPLLEHKFNFVLAGLHNVSRYSHNDNGSIPQLGEPLIIKPFSAAEARKFIETPLKYAGYFFENPDEQISIINSKLNSYPGLLHIFCATIIKITNENYDKYFKLDSNPPYILTEEILGNILTEGQIIQLVRNKFDMTLRVHDGMYKRIASAIALDYTYNEKKSGCTASELRNDYFKNMNDDKKMESLLLEMCDLGILSKNNNKYFFKRYDILKMLQFGNDEYALLDEIEKVI